MAERSNVSPEERIEEAPVNTSNPQGGETHPLSMASEAAAERAMDDQEPREVSELQRLEGELAAKQAELEGLTDKFLRLNAEFDNFRKRTGKERIELLSTAGADTYRKILPAIDDMERAIAQNAGLSESDPVKEGFVLIHQKLMGILAADGVHPMQAKGSDFDPDLHDAISTLPAPEPGMKGKVLDVVETGYTINERVLRHAKVVVAGE